MGIFTGFLLTAAATAPIVRPSERAPRPPLTMHTEPESTLPPAAVSSSSPETSQPIPIGATVVLLGCSHVGVVIDTIEPFDGVERLYLVRTWRTASELREVARA